MSDPGWPLPKFHFLVKIRDAEILAAEITGLETETQVIEFRHGNSKTFSNIKMPGLSKVGNVTLKKGIFRGNNFGDFYASVNKNQLTRQEVTIELLDEDGSPTISWTLINAFPTKITGADVRSTGNEVVIESIEFAHEGLTVTNK